MTPLGPISSSIIENFRIKFANLFPMANTFKLPEKLERLRIGMTEAAECTDKYGVFYNSFISNSTLVYDFDGQDFNANFDICQDKLAPLSIQSNKLINGDVSNSVHCVQNSL